MNKYRDMTNEQISLAVVIALGAKEVSPDVYHDGDRYYEFHCLAESFFDPCNNPSDAMPIIIENKITVAYDKLYETWCAHVGSVMGDGDWDYSIEPAINYCDDNYYRAAMICFLMMKDAENEK